jgi:hypothetical protein
MSRKKQRALPKRKATCSIPHVQEQQEGGGAAGKSVACCKVQTLINTSHVKQRAYSIPHVQEQQEGGGAARKSVACCRQSDSSAPSCASQLPEESNVDRYSSACR